MAKKGTMEDLANLFVRESKEQGVCVLGEQEEGGTISTGSYSLNAILSGSIYKGIPDNKTIALCGPSNTGKSFVLAQIVKSAQEQGFLPVVFDSERAVEKDYYERIGANTKAMVRYPVSTHMEFRNSAYSKIKAFIEKHPDIKLFLALDSLGNLAGDKEMIDAEKGKSAADMGNSAKMMNSAFRVINSLVSKYNIPFVFTNHVYDDPSNMFATRGKMSGGAKAIYNSHIIIYFSKSQLKEDVTLENGKSKAKKTGLYMKATTIKNRVVPEEQTAELEVRFKTGITKYYDLDNYALGAGVFEKHEGKKGTYVKHLDKYVPSTRLYTDEVFTKEVLDAIDVYVSETNKYCSSTDSELTELENEIENKD